MNRTGIRNPETAIAVAVMLAAFAFRVISLERAQIEHFDEGVYASVLWYDPLFGSAYPGRDFYAPPLLGKCMQVLAWIPGLTNLVPVLPAVLCGALTPLMFWRMARSWFGHAAGLFALTVSAFSDFHIFYSRTALTDVPVLLLILGSVSLGVSGTARQSYTRMILSGILCGAAWWTKYTGWLPLAIVGAGTCHWWIWRGRSELSLSRHLKQLLTMAVVAGLVWLPWYIHLQPSGGYSAIASNHRSYMNGFSSWQQNLATHLSAQFLMDGWPGCLSLGIGLLTAGIFRWRMARNSTWNEAPERVSHESYPPRRLLLRFAAAAVSLTVISLTVWTPLLLACVAMGGISGIFLWPVLQRAWTRSLTRDLSPAETGSVPLTATDLQCAPTINPDLGICVVTAWCVGMLVTTPLYHPYPRLFMPLLAGIWLGASAGVGWWVESNLSVARRRVSGVAPSALTMLGQKLVLALLIMALVASLQLGSGLPQSAIHRDRSSMRRTAVAVTRLCLERLKEDRSLPVEAAAVPEGIIRPDDELSGTLKAAVDASALDLKHDLPTPVEVQSKRFVVYVYGEPALLFHLSSLGVSASPVSHLNLQSGTGRIPTFLCFGPHARTTDSFWDEWLAQDFSYRHIGNVTFEPSELVLFDLFRPEWLRTHPESTQQTMELYEVCSPAAPNNRHSASHGIRGSESE